MMTIYPPVLNVVFHCCGPSRTERDSNAFAVYTGQLSQTVSGADNSTVPPPSKWPRTAVISFHVIKEKQQSEKTKEVKTC